MRFKAVILLLLIFFAAPRSYAEARPFYAPDNSVSVTDRNFLPLRNILSGKDGIMLPVALEKITPWLVLSVLAAEDKRFFEHGGVDFKASARALWQNINAGRVVSGASTITQQLANAINPKERTFKGKLKEAYAAASLERELSKEEILEAYFNAVNFGGNIYGVQAAALVYFDTDVSALSLSQAAFLAGLIKSPTQYNPLKNLKGALKRRNEVLNRMLENGFINEELYSVALEEEIKISPQNKKFTAPHYGLFVASKAPAGSALIQSTIDGKIQSHIEEILPGYVETLKKNNVTNAAAVVLDNKTGEVLALAGSADYFDEHSSGQVNGALSLRQPGSALKPFVYGAAFEEGFLPSDKVEDEDKFFKGSFRPKNYDEEYHGSPSMRQALACSYNIPAVQVAGELGAYKVLETLKKAGFSSLGKTSDFYGLGLALGNGEVTLLELANAYRALANGGVWRPMVYALNPQVKQAARPQRVFSAETAFMLTDILADNNARAAAFGLNSPLNMPFDFASKTGTSKDYKDNWAVGYSRRFTVAVWVGNFDASPMRRISGITGAAPILRDIAVFLDVNYPSDKVKTESSFDMSPSLAHADICPVSGRLASKNCTGSVREVFPVDKLPKDYCPLSLKEHQEEGGPVLGAAEGIIFPAEGDVFVGSPSLDAEAQQIKFKASEEGFWFLDGEKLPCPRAKECFWQIISGKHRLKFEGRKNYEVSFEVLN
ncbi:MAG: penicillin-binding protein 1C [Elusimicrobiaceae bacterium]